jgi:hypothetical protein
MRLFRSKVRVWRTTQTSGKAVSLPFSKPEHGAKRAAVDEGFPWMRLHQSSACGPCTPVPFSNRNRQDGHPEASGCRSLGGDLASILGRRKRLAESSVVKPISLAVAGVVSRPPRKRPSQGISTTTDKISISGAVKPRSWVRVYTVLVGAPKSPNQTDLARGDGQRARDVPAGAVPTWPAKLEPHRRVSVRPTLPKARTKA